MSKRIIYTNYINIGYVSFSSTARASSNISATKSILALTGERTFASVILFIIITIDLSLSPASVHFYCSPVLSDEDSAIFISVLGCLASALSSMSLCSLLDLQITT